jgi:hypothetical protein
MVGSISTPFGSQATNASKSIETPSNLDVKLKLLGGIESSTDFE